MLTSFSLNTFINWLEPAFLSAFIVSLVLFLALVILTIVFIINRKREQNFSVTIKDQSNSMRVFKVDLKEGTVLYFSRSNLKNKRLLSLEQFYEQFHFEDRKKLREWIEDFFDERRKQPPMYLEADVTISKSHKTNYSLLEVIHFNKEAKVIHIESHILRYTIPKNKVKTTRGLIPTIEMMNKYFIMNKPTGTTFLIRFYLNEHQSEHANKSNRIIFSQLKDQLFPFASNKSSRHLIEVDENDIAFIDFRLNKRQDAIYMSHVLAHTIKQFISLNSLSSQVIFSIGVVENKTFPSDLEKIIDKGIETALVAKNKREDIAFYEDVQNEDKLSSVYAKEINSIIKDKAISYRYRPILDVNKNDIIGYFSYAKPLHSVFTTSYEIREYAMLNGQQKMVFSVIARNLISKFISMRGEDSNRLFFECFYQDKEQIFNVIKHVNRVKEIKLVLLFDEKDLAKFAQDSEDIINTFLSFKKENWEIALSLSGHDLLLSSELYKMFDHFVVGSSFNQEFMRYPSKVRLSFQSTIEKLLRYKKPIIATNLIGWNTIELMIKLGIRYISSDDLANADEMILPIERKKLHKIEQIDK